MKKYGFLLDVDKCIGCRSCEMACVSTNSWNVPFRRLQQVEEWDSGELKVYFLSLGCHHCEDPECIRVCKENAYSKRKDGIVVHDTDRCKACLNCVRSCPFAAPQFNPVAGIVDKCDMCTGKLENGGLPNCVGTCPTGAISIVDHNAAEPHQYLSEFVSFTNTALTRPTTRFKRPKKQTQWFV